MRQTRKIYDSNFYKVQFITNEPRFQKFVDELIKKFAKFGCPIPKDGFKDYQEYLDWNNKYFNKYSQIENSREFKAKINKITGAKDSWGTKEQDQIEKLREEELPPMYGTNIDDLLFEYGIERKNKKYQVIKDFIIEYIFFKTKEFSNPYFKIKWQRNERLQEPELLIKILPHTRKEDLINNWDQIKQEQKHLPGYKSKFKQYKNFHRDLEIYNIYKSLKAKKAGPDSKRLDLETWKQVSDKHGDLAFEVIRKIVSDIDKLKKSCGL